MNEGKRKVIRDMIDGIDEKYINGTAERLYKKMGTVSEMTEIIVDKPVEKKRSIFSRAASVALPAAAVLVIAVCAVFFIKQLPTAPQPQESSAGTSATSVPPSSVSDTKDEVPLPEDNLIGQIVAFDGYGVKLYREENAAGTYETLYLGLYSKTSAESLYFTYNTGMTPITFGDNYYPSICRYELDGGDLVAMFIPHKTENEQIEYGLTLYHTSPENIEPIRTWETLVSSLNFLSDISRSQDLIYFFPDRSNSFVVGADIERKVYHIDFVNNTAEENPEAEAAQGAPVDVYDLTIDLSELMKVSEGFNTKKFEDIYYGHWKRINDTEVMNLTYYGDQSFEMWGRLTGSMAEIDEGTLMIGMNGGLGTCLFRPKNDNNIMYYYGDLGGVFELSRYSAVYERLVTDDGVFDGELKPGSLTGAGITKLKEITGADISLMPDPITDSSGKEWKQQGHMFFGTGRFYLQGYDERSIKYSAQYSPADIDLDDYTNYTADPAEAGFRYLSFQASKNVSDEWEILTPEEFDHGLESAELFPTENTRAAQELTDTINADIKEKNPDDELSSFVISLTYLPTSDGHYYVCRRIGNDMALDLQYTEYYYFDGLKYIRLDAGEGYTERKEYAMCGDVLFVFMQSDGGGYYVKAAKDGKYRSSTQAFGNGLEYDHALYSMDAYKLGLYTIVKIRTLEKSVEGNLIYNGNPVDSGFIPFEKVTLDEDELGFTAEYSHKSYDFKGELCRDTESGRVRYRPDSDKLSDVLWSLDNEAGIIWSLRNGVSKADPDAEIIYDSFNTAYYFIGSRSELMNYISSIYTEERALYIMQSFVKTSWGKAYCGLNTAGGNPEIGAITCELESEDESKGVIRYTAYKWDFEKDELSDEVYLTYTVNAVKTDYGWRLINFYSVR